MYALSGDYKNNPAKKPRDKVFGFYMIPDLLEKYIPLYLEIAEMFEYNNITQEFLPRTERPFSDY